MHGRHRVAPQQVFYGHVAQLVELGLTGHHVRHVGDGLYGDRERLERLDDLLAARARGLGHGKQQLLDAIVVDEAGGVIGGVHPEALHMGALQPGSKIDEADRFVVTTVTQRHHQLPSGGTGTVNQYARLEPLLATLI